MNPDKLIIGLLACQSDEDQLRRDVCERTWLQQARRAGIDYVFIQGGHPAEARVEQYLKLDVRDLYEWLPAKTFRFLKWAMRNPRTEWIVKGDTDTYICIERLLAYDFSHPYIGHPPNADRQHASGGCYILSRHAAEVLVRNCGMPKSGNEDQMVCQILKQNGIRLHKDPRFDVWGNNPPRPDNDVISTHKKWQQHEAIHKELYG
jgi:hypothetical protein